MLRYIDSSLWRDCFTLYNYSVWVTENSLDKYSRMDYVRKCVNTRFEMASSSLEDKWLDDQFQTWTQIITARILSDPGFKQALLDSAGSPLFDPEEPVYATALTSARKMCVQRKLLTWPSWITIPTRVT